MKQTPEYILKNLEHYACCMACGSIVTATTFCCPQCNGYNFERSAEAVRRQVYYLVTRQQSGVEKEDLQ